MDDHEQRGVPQVVSLPTIDQTPRVFGITLSVRHHAWATWAAAAIDHEHFAAEARLADPSAEYQPSLIAITSAAFALDALYGVALGYVASAAPVDADRHVKVADALWRCVEPRKVGATWPKRIKRLYAQRTRAVHFKEVSAEPVWHPAYESHTAAEVYEWRVEEATVAVDLVFEILTAWAYNAAPDAQQWPVDNAPLVASLVARRKP